MPFKLKSPFIITSLFAVLGLIYNSWPLGYFLDRAVYSSKLASNLEDPGRPYSWVFIATDVIFSIGLIFLAMHIHSLFKRIKFNPRLLITIILTGLFIFSLFTGFGAAAPDRCRLRHISICVSLDGVNLSPDGLMTTMAGVGLLLSLAASALLSLRLELKHRISSWSIFIAYLILGLLLVRGVNHGLSVVIVQRWFLITCWAGLISIGFNLDKILSRQHSPRHIAA